MLCDWRFPKKSKGFNIFCEELIRFFFLLKFGQRAGLFTRFVCEAEKLKRTEKKNKSRKNVLFSIALRNSAHHEFKFFFCFVFFKP